MELIQGFVWFLAFLIALSVHEYSHALVAFVQGDDTAERMGRLTLNPLAHADKVGTFLLPIIAILTGLPVIGWAKPVHYNPYNLRNQKWGPVAVGMAGPLSNFLLAAIGLVGIRLALGPAALGGTNLLTIFLFNLVMVNIWLGVFNLIPVPPLDGFKLAAAFLDSPRHRHLLHTLETQGPNFLLLILLIDLFSPISVFGGLFGGAADFAFRLAGLQ